MAPGHRFHHTILREYDIRGIVGETLTEDDARAVGAAFATIIARGGGRRICLGYDGSSARRYWKRRRPRVSRRQA